MYKRQYNLKGGSSVTPTLQGLTVMSSTSLYDLKQRQGETLEYIFENSLLAGMCSQQRRSS